MVHRFRHFEIDEEQREIRAGGRVVEVQPRVFELLVYLAKNRHRVVPKEELLDSVWPGVVVTDASLQRAISLARSALAAVGVEDAITTRARQGYRLVVEPEGLQTPPAAAGALARAHAAYAEGAWADAVFAFKEVDDLEGLSADDLQRWAHATQCLGNPDEALPMLERAVAAFSARGDRRRAAWAAILSAHLHIERRRYALANGWLQRASRLLAGESACREQGYVAVNQARMALLENNLEGSLDAARQAQDLGRRCGDADLEGLALVHVGEALLYLGRIHEGLAALDEAGVSVVASGLSAWAGGLIYCSVIYSCMTRADWQRAAQWTEQFTRWTERVGAPAYPGLCRLHRAEVLTVRGDLRAAESETQATIKMLEAYAPWAQGDAWRVLGDILLARGECRAAREAYARAMQLGWDTGFGLALVRLAEGDASGAAQQLTGLIADNAWSGRSKRGLALAYLAIASTQAGLIDKAEATLAALDLEPALTSTPALQALLARARGELLAAQGKPTEAITQLRGALRIWQSLGAPMPLAEVRLVLARLLADQGDLEAARMEVDAACAVFEQAGAAEQARKCSVLAASWAG